MHMLADPSRLIRFGLRPVLGLAGVALAALVALLVLAGPGAAPAQAQVSGPGESTAAVPSVCDRTPAIRDAIVAKLGGPGQPCATITSAQLASITSLGHTGISESFTALKADDLAGLTGLTSLNLSGRYIFDYDLDDFRTTGRLASLPAGIFDELVNLTELRLADTQITTLPEGIFDKLTKLKLLYISNNRITALPAGVFSKLPLLEKLGLQRNQLTELPANLFAGVGRLQEFRTRPSTFSSPPLVVHLVRDPLDGSVRAWMPVGAPAWINVHITAENATPAFASVTVHSGAVLSERAAFTPAGEGSAVSLSHSIYEVWYAFWRESALLAVGDIIERPRFGDRTVAAQSYLTKTPIAPVTLPEAHGAGTLRYSLEQADGGALPEGLAFDAEARTLSGTPAEPGEFELVYRAANPRLEGMPGGDATLTFDVDVGVRPLSFDATVDDQFAQVGEAFSLTLPEAAGGVGALTYSLSAVAPGALPEGLAFDAEARTLSGTPTSVTAGTLIYEVADRAGSNRLSMRFTLSTFSATVIVIAPEPVSELPSPGVCDRTPDVRFAIMSALEARDCAKVTAAQLAGITGLRFLRLSDPGYTGVVRSLKAGDFHGLSGLTSLDLSRHQLSALPAGVFAGLDGLTSLRLDGNRLTTLPASAFTGLDGLTSLRLDGNRLTTLPAGVFAGPDGLTSLRLDGNRLTALPDGVFLDLDRLEELRLDGNAFTDSPLVIYLVEDVHDAGARSVRAAMPVGAPAAVTVAITATNATPATGALIVPAGGDTGGWLTLSTSGSAPTVRGVGAAFPSSFSYSGPPLVIAGVREAAPGARRTVREMCESGTAVPEPSANAALVGDCVTLLGLRDTLRPTEPLNWSVGLAVASWEGVTVGGTPSRVTALSLATRGLTGRVPAELGSLDALTSVDLTWNKLGGAIPAELGTLAELRSLALYRNSLTGPIPPELGTLAKLESLSLSQNFLSGSIPAELASLSTLRALHLYQNRLTGAIPPELWKLRELEALFLAENQFTGCVPRALRNVASNDLDRLGLETCALSLVEPGEGVASVPVPVTLQSAMINDQLETARALRAALQDSLGDAGSGGGASGATSDDGNAATRTRIAELDAEIARLAAIDPASLTPFSVDVPYVTVKDARGGDGIAFSKFTYEASRDASTPVGLGQKDPTQFVLWGQATAASVRAGFEHHTRLPRDLYRWENDQGHACSWGDFASPQYVAMQNTAAASGEWVWAESYGLQTVADRCFADSRHHLRYFASDDSRLSKNLGADEHDFGHWVVVAAHFDSRVEFFEHDIKEGGWEDGELRVLNSLMPPGHPLVRLKWVERVISDYDFGNSRDSTGAHPQNVAHDGKGHIIRIGALPSGDPVRLSKPPAPDVTVDGNTITVSPPAGAHWWDYQYQREGLSVLGVVLTWVDTGEVLDQRRTVTRSDLEYETKYRFRVRAYTTRAQSEWSDYTVVTTGPRPTSLTYYELTVNVEPERCATPTGGGRYLEDSSATASYSNEADDCIFRIWSENPNVTMDRNRTVTAYFDEECTLSVTRSPAAGGTVTRSTWSGACGTRVSTTATPNVTDGYSFGGWAGCTTVSGRTCEVDVGTRGGAAEDVTVTATFDPPAGTKACPDGTTIPVTDTCPTTPETKVCPDGTTIPVTDTCPTTPETKVCPDGTTIPVTDTCPTTPETKVCPDGTTIPVTDTCPTTPETKVCPDGTTIPVTDTCPTTPETKVCPDGTTVPATDSCPTYDWSWTCAGKTGSGSGYATQTLADQARDDWIEANCPTPQCTLTVNSGIGGTASGTDTVDCGDPPPPVSYRAYQCYEFSRWDGDTTSALTSNRTVTAVFRHDGSRYSVSTSVSGVGSVSAGGTYLCGRTAIVTATETDPAWAFVRWEIDDVARARSVVTRVTAQANFTTTFRVFGDKSVTAVFIFECDAIGGCRTAAGQGEGSVPATRTVTASIENEVVTLDWEAVEGADRYRVRYRSDPEGEWRELPDADATDTQLTWRPAGLACGQTHAFLVEARGDGVAHDAEWGEALPVSVSTVDCDRQPAFPPSGYSFTVAEGAAAGTVVGTVAAESVGGVSYEITGGNAAGAFAIDAESGELTVAGTLDREAPPSHVLTVRASDGAGGVGTTTVSVSVAGSP